MYFNNNGGIKGYLNYILIKPLKKILKIPYHTYMCIGICDFRPKYVILMNKAQMSTTGGRKCDFLCFFSEKLLTIIFHVIIICIKRKRHA